jgi:hypothetical protein
MRSSVTKRLDMARSILPSKARGSAAAALAAARRTNRRAVGRRLRAVAAAGVTGPGAVDDLLDGDDPWSYPDVAIGRVVRWRRGADKLNHFERWAVAVTRHLRPEDRLSHMRALLPGGLIGEHALSHLAWRPEFRVEPQRWPPFRPVPDDHDRAALLAFLHDTLRHGGHRDLNAALKRARHPGPARPGTGAHAARCLLGHHDVDRFLDDLYACAVPFRATHPEWLATVRRLAAGERAARPG